MASGNYIDIFTKSKLNYLWKTLDAQGVPQNSIHIVVNCWQLFKVQPPTWRKFKFKIYKGKFVALFFFMAAKNKWRQLEVSSLFQNDWDGYH